MGLTGQRDEVRKASNRRRVTSDIAISRQLPRSIMSPVLSIAL